jgi:cyclic pyranopterin phosphate synthase
VVPSDEILARIGSALGALESTPGPARGNGPARYWRVRGSAGSVGVITPMTHTYCESCNRVRLTADGRLRTCLFGDHEVDLRTPLRAGVPLAPYVRQALAEKPQAHALLQRRNGGLRALSQVGG